ncbi:NlpC/P60 family protein [Actinomadura sp. NPDC048394]|uniref:C40 family peptidase n=1 Tax=Actinomadura sp. NPDC048394 TaxID=3158223 RepID=UPI0033DEB81A
MGAPASAQLNPTVLRRLNLDAATLSKVKAYDRYRTRTAEQRSDARRALAFAREQIGKPYRWGAAGPSSYDCSGLAMAAWRRAGVRLPRITYAQYRSVERKVGLGGLKPGDLVFFHGRSHVGIYVGHGRFLHAPHTGARVRIDKLGAARKREFAGAVRPGAPAKQTFSPSIRELVDKIDRMAAQDREARRKPPDKRRTPHLPPPDDMPVHHPAKPPANTPAHPAAQAPRSDHASNHIRPGRPDRDPAPRPRHVRPAAQHPHYADANHANHARPHHANHANHANPANPPHGRAGNGSRSGSGWRSWTPFAQSGAMTAPGHVPG